MISVFSFSCQMTNYKNCLEIALILFTSLFEIVMVCRKMPLSLWPQFKPQADFSLDWDTNTMRICSLPIGRIINAERPYYLCLAEHAWDRCLQSVGFANPSGSLNIYSSTFIQNVEENLKFNRHRFSDVSWTGTIGYCLKSEQNPFPALLSLHSDVQLILLMLKVVRKSQQTLTPDIILPNALKLEL